MEHSVRQQAHLRVSALAGVASQDVGQRNNLLEGPE
jgi:hypothetical protein